MKLNDIDLEVVRDLYRQLGKLDSVRTFLSSEYGVKTSVPTLSRRLGKGIKHATTNEAEVSEDKEKPVAGGYTYALDKEIQELPGSRFVITSAQNNTYVNQDFLASLKNYCEYTGAQLLVSTFTYNKKGWYSEDKDEMWYDPSISGHIIDDRVRLAPGLVLCGELDILPTAILPMSGLANYTKMDSCIVPHAKMQLESVATSKDVPAKLMYTTGAVTQRNYLQKKTGQKAEFHHVYGALVVEVDEDGDWFVRQLSARDGSFYDLDLYCTPSLVESGHNAKAITLGDIHIEKIDNQTTTCVFGEGGIRETLAPEYQILHDVVDFMSRNHHNRKDPHFLAKMHYEGTETVQGNMQVVARFLNGIESEVTETVVVESNHDQAFALWLKDGAGHYDPPNALYWHEYNAYVLTCIKNGVTDTPFKEAVLDEYTALYGGVCNATFLKEDESLLLDGVENGAHGHKGPNGSRGNSKNHRNLGTKYTIGHSHTCGIIDGVYTAGVTGKLDMGYNTGPSSWSHSHVVQYQNGKRTIITQRGNKWRLTT